MTVSTNHKQCTCSCVCPSYHSVSVWVSVCVAQIYHMPEASWPQYSIVVLTGAILIHALLTSLFSVTTYRFVSRKELHFQAILKPTQLQMIHHHLKNVWWLSFPDICVVIIKRGHGGSHPRLSAAGNVCTCVHKYHHDQQYCKHQTVDYATNLQKTLKLLGIVFI